MSADAFDGNMYHREVAFCRVYSLESKEKLEKLFLKKEFPTLLNGRTSLSCRECLQRITIRKRVFYHSDQ